VPLHPFTESDDLPPGVHQATLTEALSHFGAGSSQRRMMALRLARIYSLAWATGQLARFVVFGSFVTDKWEPNDVDVFLLMEDTFDVAHLAGETRLLFDHGAAQARFGGSVFGCDVWRPLVVSRRPSNTGKSNEMAATEALSRLSRSHHDC